MRTVSPAHMRDIDLQLSNSPTAQSLRPPAMIGDRVRQHAQAVDRSHVVIAQRKAKVTKVNPNELLHVTRMTAMGRDDVCSRLRDQLAFDQPAELMDMWHPVENRPPL